MSWASAFLAIVGLGALLGFAGLVDVPAQGSWILLVCSAVFAAAFFGPTGKRRT